jgi:hypothetical protein
MSVRRLVECPKCGKKVGAEPMAKPFQALKAHMAACRGRDAGTEPTG